MSVCVRVGACVRVCGCVCGCVQVKKEVKEGEKRRFVTWRAHTTLHAQARTKPAFHLREREGGKRERERE